jgi:ABC-type Zn uptake system ZnuABC Zn-binding protein ZnuA
MALLLAIVVAACAGGRAGSAAPSGAIRVVATTTVLADLVANVGGDRVDVRSLVPKGGEVHTFDPSPGDITAVAEADLIVMNGLALDEWALDLIDGSGSEAEVVKLAEDLEGVSYLEGEHEDEGANPHLWLNVEYAALYVDRIAEALEPLSPGAASGKNAYRAELEALHDDIADRMAALPEPNRRIVSFHEAFPYFAEAYGLEIVGVVVESPGQDPSAGEIAALVAAIRESGAKAVFSEAQFDPRLAETIAAEAGVRVESGLHNDSVGDPPADSYVGLMKLNADRIEAALR